MAQQAVNIGAQANDGTGDTLRDAFEKLNANDAELYAWIQSGGLTAAEVLALLLTVDGPGSNLNADLLDGLDSAAFALVTHVHLISDVTGLQVALDGKAASVHSHGQSDITGLSASLALKLDSSAYTAADVLAKLLTVDGSGSGLDADTLDGQSSAAFAAASHTHAQSEVTGLTAALAAKLDASSYTAADVRTKLLTVDGAGSGIDADLLDGMSSAAFAAASHAHAIADVTGLQAALDDKADAEHTHPQSDVTGLEAALDAKLDASDYTAADVLAKLLTVDGAASGLDADLLDGMSSAAFAAASHTHAQSEVTGLTASLAAKLDATAFTAAAVLALLVTVDGSGSGLDADTLDGMSSAAFASASHTHAQSDITGLAASLAAKLDASAYTAADVLAKLLTVDGAASGLDADLLDGISSAGYLQTSSYQALTPTWSGDHTFSALVKIANGTDGAPSLCFSSDADLGLYRIGADNLGVSCGGTKALDISATQLLVGLSALPSGITSATFFFVGGKTASGAGGFASVSLDGTAQFQMIRYNTSYSSPTDLLSGQTVGSFSFRTWDSTAAGILVAVSMQAVTTENWISTARGTLLRINTCATGASLSSTTCEFLGQQCLMQSGTVSLPAFSFISDPDCGMYRIGANQIGIGCNATLVLDLSTSIVAITATTLRLNTTSATTVGAAGGASALPATPLGYITTNVNGTACKIPYYNT